VRGASLQEARRHELLLLGGATNIERGNLRVADLMKREGLSFKQALWLPDDNKQATENQWEYLLIATLGCTIRPLP
jgi:hypothetical protein